MREKASKLPCERSVSRKKREGTVKRQLEPLLAIHKHLPSFPRARVGRRVVDMPSKQFQYAHARQNLSEKPAPRALAWALYGHAADCLSPPLPLVEDPPWRREGRGEGAARSSFIA